MNNNQEPLFKADRVAHYEKAGWEAYYARRWLRAFRLMIALNRDGFGMSLPAAVAAAVDTVRASIAFAPLENNDLPKTRRYLERFYERARPALGSDADAAELADLELDYWIVHRELAIARKADPASVVAESLDDIRPMIDSLARLHAAQFNSDPHTMRLSAEQRALAAKTVDRITGGYSDDVPGDWARVEDYLRRAYRSIADTQASRMGGTRMPAGQTRGGP